MIIKNIIEIFKYQIQTIVLFKNKSKIGVGENTNIKILRYRLPLKIEAKNIYQIIQPNVVQIPIKKISNQWDKFIDFPLIFLYVRITEMINKIVNTICGVIYRCKLLSVLSKPITFDF